MTKKIVLLPAFNEENSVENVLRKIKQVADAQVWTYLIIACDDGSCDRTAEILLRLQPVFPLEILTHRINRGLGETVRDLFERAADIAEAGDIIFRLDCDNSHEPQHMVEMAIKLGEGFDVVTASRYQPGGGLVGVSAYRVFVSRTANLFMRLFFGIPGLKEYSCGFRAYRAEIIQRAIGAFGNNFVQLKGLGFTCTVEKLIKLKLIGARFAEVPFVLRYDQKLSTSKMVGSLTTLGYVVMTILYLWPWGGWRRGFRQLAERPASVGGPEGLVSAATRSTNP